MWCRRLALLVAVLGLAASCSRDPQKLKQKYVASGDTYVAQKKYAEAIVEYRNAVLQDAQFGEARFKLADAYERTGDLRNALREYVRAADLLPDNIDAQFRAGNMLVSAGQYQDAKNRAVAALAKDPKNVNCLMLLGNALMGLKDVDGAIQQVEAAIDADPQLSFTYTNLGTLELRKGDKGAAESAFKRAVELEPKSPTVHLNLGNFYWATGDRKQAEAELKAALAIDPKSLAANRFLAAFYALGGRAVDAEPYLKVLADGSGGVAGKLALADYYLDAKRIDDAVKVLEPLSKDKDGLAPAKLRLAVIDFTSGRRPHAYQTLDEILAQVPNHERTLEAKTKFLIFDGRNREAAQLAQTVVKANPQAVRSHFLNGIALEGTGAIDDAIKAFQHVLDLAPSALPAHMELAKAYLLRGETKPALEHLGLVLKAQPQSGPAHLLLGQAQLQAGNIRAAEAEILPLAKANPKSVDVQSWLARLYLAKDDRVQARSAFARVADLQPDSFIALDGLVTLDLVEKKPAAARSRIEAQLAKRPDDVAVLFLAGNTYLRTGDAKQGEAMLRKVVQLTPTHMGAYAQLVQLYFKQQRLDEARADLEAAAKHQDKPVGVTTLLGMIDEMQNKPAEARKQYERALDMDPNAAVAANNLAWQYAETGGNLDVALKLAETAKSKLPEDAQVSDTLGWVYYKKGLMTLAISTLLQGAKLNPSSSVIHYHLGLAYLKNGNRDEAERSLRQALKLNGDFKNAADARQVLASIKG